jgi:hypothetical protein
VVGDETEDELESTSGVRLSGLAWLMERYPAFGELVFSGARRGVGTRSTDWKVRAPIEPLTDLKDLD